MLPYDEVARLRAGLPPEVLLVLDAAYAEYVERPDYDPGVRLVDAGDNTVMLRTFSKIFGLGGMRIGWAYAPPAVIDVLNRVRAPFNVTIAGAGGGDRRAGRAGLGGEGPRAQHRIRAEAGGGAAGGGHQGLAIRGQFRARRFRHAGARRARPMRSCARAA